MSRRHGFSGLQDAIPAARTSDYPTAADREQARRFGQRGERSDFENWARLAYKGQFFHLFDAEYRKGTTDK